MQSHTARCIDNGIWAIAENNAWTLADGQADDIANMTPQTPEWAEQWINEGNVDCRCND